MTTPKEKPYWEQDAPPCNFSRINEPNLELMAKAFLDLSRRLYEKKLLESIEKV